MSTDILDYDLSVKWVNSPWNYAFRPGDKIFVKGRMRMAYGIVVKITPNAISYRYGDRMESVRPSQDVKCGYSVGALIKYDSYTFQKSQERLAANRRARALLVPSNKQVYKKQRPFNPPPPKDKNAQPYEEPVLSSFEMSNLYNYNSYHGSSGSAKKIKSTGFLIPSSQQWKGGQFVESKKTEVSAEAGAEEEAELGLFSEIVIITNEEYERIAAFQSKSKLYYQVKKAELADKELEHYVKKNNIQVPKRFIINDSKIKKSYQRYFKNFESEHGENIVNNLKKNINLDYLTADDDEVIDGKSSPDMKKSNREEKKNEEEEVNQPNGGLKEDNFDEEEYQRFKRFFEPQTGNGYDDDECIDYTMDQSDTSSVYYDADDYSIYSGQDFFDSNPTPFQGEEEEDEENGGFDDDTNSIYSSVSNSDYYSTKSYDFYNENGVDNESVVQSKVDQWEIYENKYGNKFSSNPSFLRAYKALEDLFDGKYIQEAEFNVRRTQLVSDYFEKKIDTSTVHFINIENDDDIPEIKIF